MKKLNTLIVLLLLCSFADNLFSQTPTPTIFYSNSSGDLGLLASWDTNPTGTGTNPPSGTDFTDGTTHTFVIANRASYTHNTAWNLSASKLVVVGTGTTAISLTIGGSPTGAINTTNIQTANNSTLTLTNTVAVSTSTFNNLNSNSWVIYNASNSNVNPSVYSNLGISHNSSLSGNVSVTGTLNIANTRSLTVGSNSLSLMGKLTSNATGSIATNSSSRIYIGAGGSASGAIGTLRFAGSSPVLGILDITINNVSSTVTLGSNITFSGTGSYFGLFKGSLDIGSQIVTIDPTSDINFPSTSQGELLSNGGSIFINGTIAGNFGSNSLNANTNFNSFKTLAINSANNQLDIGSGLKILDSLSVLDGEIITNSNVTLTATSSLKARMGRVGSSGVVTGDITVETFIPGSTTGWANLGVNGVTGQTVANWDTYVSSGGANGIPMVCTGCAYSQSVMPNWFNSIAGWNESTSQYDTMVVASTSLDTGRGFWVYVGDGFSTTNDLKLVNTGPIVQGPVSVGLTAAGTGTDQGYNLVANPYASPIGWSKVLAASGGTASGIADAIYVWNADLGVTTSLSNGLPSHGSGGITNVIPAGQGFYVATTTATNLVFNESVKLNNNTSTNPLLKPASPSSTEKVFRLRLQGTYDADETAFRFNSDATSGFDRSWDAKKFFQSPGYAGYPGPYTKYTTISSKDNMNEDYSINSNPPLTTSLSIPVLAKVSSTGTYTISAKDFQNFDMCVGLIDRMNNSYHDLRTADYVCTINDSISTVRFDLVLCKDQSLEITSVGQTPAATNNNVLINQDAQGPYVKTAFEKNTKATISAYNIMGQKIMEDITVYGTVNTTYLPLNMSNQVVFIKTISDSGMVSKKILLH